MTNTTETTKVSYSHMVRVTQDGVTFPVALVDLAAAEGFIEGLDEIENVTAWKLFERVGTSEVFREV